MKNNFILATAIIFICYIAVGYSENKNIIITKLKEKCSEIKTFKANFLQKHYSALTKEEVSDKGIIYYQSPNLIRFEYGAPTKNLFVAKDYTSYFYNSQDNIVYKSSYNSSQKNLSWLFLLNGCNIDNYFNFKEIKETKEKYILIILSKLQDEEIKEIVLEIQKKNLDIQKIAIYNAIGDSNTFYFSNIKKNIYIDENLFNFNIPKNAEIIYLD